MTERKEGYKNFAITIAIICMVAGAIVVEFTAMKIANTAADLCFLRWNAEFYNEQQIKTDQMTKDETENIIARQAIYNSDDALVRNFARSNFFVKLIIALGAVVLVIGIPISPVLYVIYYIHKKDLEEMHKRISDRKARLAEPTEVDKLIEKFSL